ncbi:MULTISPECIES: sporulation delaying protein family toxin [Staphylococcus]|uniref:sporulation delaying protein family toxin n=1 Tax=Staphylococcus TaxID=1279 RepID=UPI0011A9DB94|nr:MULTISPECIES: sporulation delaying protein family toxin [Staphylococcus]HCX9014047.1 sporulation delaying protein family toxin [Staphylococcus aureus]MBO1199982.1 sporulation delaying protein family toxin [Staphylococcus simiae]MBO1202252.1 sporulation delaying protein family toxin [Staphylococcus simiae]MBO1212051.1 sporulation delaying protein family toxin [Staphylococcus simiae]MBO1230534.1 sporulation delaying protein family toxin [Staphylococcus simiae]
MHKSKFFKIFLSIAITIAFSLSFFNTENNALAKGSSKYSGEELYKGIVFGQDEIGKKLVSNNEEYTKMNSPETKKFLNGLTEYINQKDSSYFSNLKNAVDNNDPNKTLKLLQSSGKYFDQYLEKTNAENKPKDGTANRCGVAAVCVAAVAAGVYNYAVAVQAGAVVQVGYAVWALKTKTVNNATRSTDSLNQSNNPEQEVAKVLKIINEG